MLPGIDVSKWQGEMDWHKARSAGARFAFIRAGSIDNGTGICYTDYQLERNARIAPEYMPVGFYWYYRPQFDAIKQANYFCSLIRDTRRSLPPVLDLETTGNLSPTQITNAATDFILQVYSRLNVWSLLYSRALWLNLHTIPCNVWQQIELWIARYINLPGPWSDGYCIPRDFKNWRFWQHSADNNGRGAEFGAKSKSIDLDYFNGTQEELNAYCGKPNTKLIRITSTLAASIRSSQEGAAIGATWRGAEWPVNAVSGDYYRVEGWIHKDKTEEI